MKASDFYCILQLMHDDEPAKQTEQHDFIASFRLHGMSQQYATLEVVSANFKFFGMSRGEDNGSV